MTILDPTDGAVATLWKRLIEAFGGTAPTDSSDYALWQALITAVAQGGGGGGGLVFNVKGFGATGNGTTDDTTALVATFAAAHAGGGIVWFPPGFYKVQTGALKVTKPDVSVLGVNSNVVKLQPVGSGDCIRWQMNPFNQPLSGPTSGPWGGNGGAATCGKIGGLTIDGTNASAGAVGLHYGDAINGEFDDLAIFNFATTAGIGLWMDNVSAYTEGTLWDRVSIANCTQCVLFDINGGQNSFGYQRIKKLRLTLNAGQVGVRIQAGALVYNGEFNISANMAPSAGNPPTFMQVAGIPSVGDTTISGIYAITVEQTGGSTGQSNGIQITDIAYMLGSGHIDLSSNSPVSSVASGGFYNLNGWMKLPGLNSDTPITAGLQCSGLTFSGSVNALAVPSVEIGVGRYGTDNLVVCANGGYIALQPNGYNVGTGEVVCLATGELIATGPTATSATGGSATALPSLPVGYLDIQIGVSAAKIPYYGT